MKYPFIPIEEIQRYLPLIHKLGVSKKATSKNQFLEMYKKHHVQLPTNWLIKRENFINRHFAQYKVYPSLRRRLALIVWAFDPEDFIRHS